VSGYGEDGSLIVPEREGEVIEWCYGTESSKSLARLSLPS